MAAVIWHNFHIGRPVTRSLITDDYRASRLTGTFVQNTGAHRRRQ
ncbi:hypothetical protein ACQP2T_29485 [Nonomuraea sp. CA-143628]